jgi:mannose-1-phosphate guanylyltransferase
MDTAVMIAGGRGLRLSPLTDDRPKTLIPVAGRPILHYMANWLKSYGVSHLVIGVAHMKEKIYEYMKENDNFGMDVDFSEHTVEGGTAEGFKLAIKRFVKDEDFFAMNSDELTNMNLHDMEKTHLTYRPTLTLALAPLHVRLSIIDHDSENRIKKFTYGKKMQDIKISNGIYAFNRGIIDYIPDKGSIENDAFVKLTGEEKARSHLLKEDEDWCTVNTAKDVEEAEEKLREWGVLGQK